MVALQFTQSVAQACTPCKVVDRGVDEFEHLVAVPQFESRTQIGQMRAKSKYRARR